MATFARTGVLRMVGLLLVSLALLGAPAALAAEFEGVQASGALYRLVVPDANWNGRLVVWAHGYVPFFFPLGFYDTLPDGTHVEDVVTSLGYAYAASSYRTNGLAVLEGVEDLRDLVTSVFPTATGLRPALVYLVGASQSGLITTLSVEQHPDVYAGGLAACGPVGGFRKQMNYFGNARALFDYYFPGLIPGSPIDIPPEVIAGWETFYVLQVALALAAEPDRAAEAARVAGLAFDPAAPSTLVESWVGILSYNVYGTNDAKEKLGGTPFDNQRRFYLGSSNDVLLNLRIKRFAADPVALAALKAYETSGVVERPIVTLHTTLDPIVPYWQEGLYRRKTLASGSARRHVNIPIVRYGHCSFERDELLVAFGLLVLATE